MTILGKLTTIAQEVDNLRWPLLTAKNTRVCLQTIIMRMVQIDRDITASAYNGGDDSKDRPPTGDDYNLLWDAILDEINSLVVS